MSRCGAASMVRNGAPVSVTGALIRGTDPRHATFPGSKRLAGQRAPGTWVLASSVEASSQA